MALNLPNNSSTNTFPESAELVPISFNEENSENNNETVSIVRYKHQLYAASPSSVSLASPNRQNTMESSILSPKKSTFQTTTIQSSTNTVPGASFKNDFLPRANKSLQTTTLTNKDFNTNRPNETSFTRTGSTPNSIPNSNHPHLDTSLHSTSKLLPYKSVSTDSNESSHEELATYGCNWHNFPVIVSIAEFVGAQITYQLARINCHVQQFWVPYISYTGNYHPEYMMFGFLLNASSFLNAAAVILIWRLLAALQPTEKRYIQNTCVVGLVGCLGLCVVANFQVEKAPYAHYMGAFAAFVFNTVFIYLVSQILDNIRKHHESLNKSVITPDWLMKVRWFITYSAAISFAGCFLITSIAPLVPQFDGHTEKFIENLTNPNCAHSNNEVLTRIKPLAGDDKNDMAVKLGLPKYATRYNLIWSIGAVFEWANCFCYLIYHGLFYFEFQQFKHVKVVLKDQDRHVLGEDFNEYFGRNGDQPILVPITVRNKPSYMQHRRGRSYGCETLVLSVDKDDLKNAVISKKNGAAKRSSASEKV